MSLTKRALPEDVDVTDPRDTGHYGEPEALEPDHVGFLLWELERTTKGLEEHAKTITVGDLQTLASSVERLQGIVKHVTKGGNPLKPF